MQKQVVIVFLICLLNICVFGQAEQTAISMKWEYYKVGEKGIALLLPKMPILINTGDQCREEETNEYAVYAAGAVYGLNITNKIPDNVRNHCIDKKDFSGKNFSDRIETVKNQLKTQEEVKFNQSNLEVIKIKSGDSSRWFFNDLKNNRWFELWVVGADETKPEVKRFIESIRFDKNTPGIEIGNGAIQTLGDENLIKESNDSASIKAPTGESKPIRIILRPKPPYTEAARQNQTTGVTRLRVTFLANGGIGSVTPVTGLPYGLTEQAISAAKKIVFIPQKVGDKPVTVSKLVEYSFSIY